MIIDINTDQLQSVVHMARVANEAISDAANLLNSVVAHDDWQCPERNEINSGITQNRSLGLALQTDAEHLYANISYATDCFLAAEQEICGSFQSVDGPIASFLSQVPNTWANPNLFAHNVANGGIVHASAEALKGAGGGVASAIKKGLDVVSFDNIADALKGE